MSSDTESAHHRGHYATKDLLPDALDRDGTFSSLKSRPFSPPMPPATTNMPTGRSFDLSISTPTPSSQPPTVRTITPEPAAEKNISRPRPKAIEKPKFTQPEWNF